MNVFFVFPVALFATSKINLSLRIRERIDSDEDILILWWSD